MKRLSDNFNRTMDYLRISLTNRCNLNCLYCNPASGNRTPLTPDKYLSNEELFRIIKLFVSQYGFRKIRFTGGEPLVRKDIFSLFGKVNELKKFYNFETGITTNGTLLKQNLGQLKQTGIDKLNISLDTLDKDKFKFITGRDYFYDVFEAIVLAKDQNFSSLKINVVIVKGLNDNELISFVDFATEYDLNVRFIEYMPFGNNLWNKNGFISCKEMISVIQSSNELVGINSEKNSVSKNFSIKNKKGTIGFISSISDNFCKNCNRLRLTSDGKLKMCLFSTAENDLDLKEMLSGKILTDEDISFLIDISLMNKPYKHPEIGELLRLEKNNMLSIGG